MAKQTMKIGDELTVKGVVYVLVDGAFIKGFVSSGDLWICDLCHLENTGDCEFISRCGRGNNIFVKKLEV